jgi:hypothetical protein
MASPPLSSAPLPARRRRLLPAALPHLPTSSSLQLSEIDGAALASEREPLRGAKAFGGGLGA